MTCLCGVAVRALVTRALGLRGRPVLCRAVGVPAPIFYAHKSCTRVRVLLTAMTREQREDYITAMSDIGKSTYVQPKSMLF